MRSYVHFIARSRGELERLPAGLDGVLVIDEAYIEFARAPSLAPLIRNYPNLVVSRTLSKAYAAAGIRLGYGFAIPEIIHLLQTVKAPYNLNTLTRDCALSILADDKSYETAIDAILAERDRLVAALRALPAVRRVLKSDANFITFEIPQTTAIFQHLVARNLIVRDRSREPGLADCLRLTVGTPEENQLFLDGLQDSMAIVGII